LIESYFRKVISLHQNAHLPVYRSIKTYSFYRLSAADKLHAQKAFLAKDEDDAESGAAFGSIAPYFHSFFWHKCRKH